MATREERLAALADQGQTQEPERFVWVGEIRQTLALDALAKAMVKAQAAMPDAKREASNPFFNSKYSTLTMVRECSKEVLGKNGLCVIQLPHLELGGEGLPPRVCVTTRLLHESGQWIEGAVSCTLPGKSGSPDTGAQAVGACITYLRRYGLGSILGVASEDDDDGETASGRGKGQKPRAESNQGDPSTPKEVEFIARKTALWDYLVKITGSKEDAKVLLMEITCNPDKNFDGFYSIAGMKHNWQIDNAREALKSHPVFKKYIEDHGDST